MVDGGAAGLEAIVLGWAIGVFGMEPANTAVLRKGIRMGSDPASVSSLPE